MKNSLILLAAIGCLAAPVFGAETSNQNAQPGKRYLFIVDTSSAMKRLAGQTRDYVFELVFTGLDGQMQPGDSFGLWGFAEATVTDFPMQLWNPTTSFYAAAATMLFLTGQR